MNWIKSRSFTLILLPLSLAASYLRMVLTTPGGQRLGNLHEAGAFLGGVVGGALMPWAFGGLVMYGHWLWWKARASAEAMRQDYLPRRQLVLNSTVLILALIMLLESLLRTAAK